ncbi:phosphoribosylanthranilate isomerase [Croceicoccus marinus]|uniref:N-(5'-phosphoribosyl)anthranilate isomerase n=1 Tax=Croceicoccus marinus TaxID=450378 RepID=A0A7G6VS06_9SPHN|nr:phosphoribosylanthranilate isomerase [Croceicoccus marinus]QNE04521.1 phosphoribosylanthranilate isomerase [Croceicoccus marinus]
MGNVKIKICGISDGTAMDAAIDAGADYAGLVFYPPSPRHIGSNDAALLAERSARRIARVGLFVDADDTQIGDAVAAGRLDALQLHGSETPGRAADLRARFGLPVWKAIAVSSASDVERAEQYAGAADLVLFDARTPKGTLPGGMGLSFDWSLLRHYRGSLPWGLAGGIAPANVAHAIAQTGAPLVDVSSGVESASGVKDPARIKAFVSAVRKG